MLWHGLDSPVKLSRLVCNLLKYIYLVMYIIIVVIWAQLELIYYSCSFFVSGSIFVELIKSNQLWFFSWSYLIKFCKWQWNSTCMFFATINDHTQIWTSEQDKDTNDPFLIIAVKGKKSSSNSFNGVKQKQLMKTFQTFCLVHHREKDRYSYFLLVFGCNFNGIQCKIWIWRFLIPIAFTRIFLAICSMVNRKLCWAVENDVVVVGGYQNRYTYLHMVIWFHIKLLVRKITTFAILFFV